MTANNFWLKQRIYYRHASPWFYGEVRAKHPGNRLLVFSDKYLPGCFAPTGVNKDWGLMVGVEKPGFCYGYQGLSVGCEKETRFLVNLLVKNRHK